MRFLSTQTRPIPFCIPYFNVIYVYVTRVWWMRNVINVTTLIYFISIQFFFFFLVFTTPTPEANRFAGIHGTALFPNRISSANTMVLQNYYLYALRYKTYKQKSMLRLGCTPQVLQTSGIIRIILWTRGRDYYKFVLLYNDIFSYTYLYTYRIQMYNFLVYNTSYRCG